MTLSVLILILSGSAYFGALDPLREEIARLKVNDELSNLFGTIQKQPEAVLSNSKIQCAPESSRLLPLVPGYLCNKGLGLYAAILNKDGDALNSSPSWANEPDALLDAQFLKILWRDDTSDDFRYAIPGILGQDVRVWTGQTFEVPGQEARVIMLAFPKFMDDVDKKLKMEGSESEEHLQLVIVIVATAAAVAIVLQTVVLFRIRRSDSLGFTVNEYRQWMVCTSWISGKTHEYWNELRTFSDLSEFTSYLELDVAEHARVKKLQGWVAELVQELQQEGAEAGQTTKEVYTHLAERWNERVLCPLRQAGDVHASFGAATDTLEEMSRFSPFWIQSVEQLVAKQCAIGEVPVLDVIQLASDIADSYVEMEQGRICCTIDGYANVRANKGDIRSILSNLIDNAFKHARYEVRIYADINVEGKLSMRIENDGHKVEESNLESIWSRSSSGHGLAFVHDLVVSKYGGKREARNLPEGTGVSFEVTFDYLDG